MANYQNKGIIIQRFNDAIRDLLQADLASQNNETNRSKHLRDAGEAISQTIEWALKHHLNLYLPVAKRINPNDRISIKTLLDYYANPFYRSKTCDGRPSSVNFQYLLNEKAALTNKAKHAGDVPNAQIQNDYIEEVRKFIKEYIDSEADLKSKTDFPNGLIGSWYTFYSACNKFKDEDTNYILLIGKNCNIDQAYLQYLILPSWTLIIDFDFESRNTGFFAKTYGNGIDITPHIFTAKDPAEQFIFSQYTKVPYIYFANNYEGEGAGNITEFRTWQKQYGRNTTSLLRNFADAFPNQRTIVVVLYNARPFVNFVVNEITQVFGDSASFIFSGPNIDSLSAVCEDYEGVYIPMTYQDLVDGFKDIVENFEHQSIIKQTICLPYNENSLSKTTGVLAPEEYNQFSEYFEILHLSLPDPEKGNDRKVFLRGEEQISWYGLSKRFDVERQKFNKYYISPIKKTIDLGHGIVYLTHEAGFGGTTIARRIAWEIHEDNPTLIMTKFHERKTREILIQLHEKTRKTILIIMEAPQVIALDDVNNLYASISQSRPVVFLVVRRGRPSKTDLAVPDWGNNVTDLIEAYKPFIQERYGEYLQSSKNKELNNIIHSTESYKKTPFYVGLVALESDFVAIHSYIAKFLYEVNENIEQKRTLVYLTLCMDYLGTGLPSTFFRNLFKASTNTNFNLEDYFPSDSSLINALLNVKKEGKIKYWSIRHPFFAKELKRQLLGGVGTKNPEIWKETLSDWCVHFIEDSLADVALSEYMATIFQKLFIGNRIDRSGDKFTQIINDVDTDSAREKLFQTLKNSYPENPHFCSHLARFYAYRIKNNELALKYADQAIRLSQQIAQPDSLLYHIKGMCIRTKIYELIDNLISQKQRGIKISETEFNHIIDNLVPEAAQQFATSRQLNKKDEYGYIAHIQMLVRVLDFAIKVSNKTKSEFISSCKTPYTEWLDLAESLIEEVKLLNWDTTSSYITDCENGLSELYDDYSTILQNLRNYLPKSSDPSRIRRLIVRTYFRKSGNRLTNAPDLLKLMEQNIENEPENTYNYLLWFKVIRFTNSKINDVVDKVSRWNANSRGAIETIYYFYVLKTFQALEGYSEAELEAARLIRECRTKNRQGTISIFDWYGKGMGIHKLISNKLVTDNNKNELLDYVEGYFTEFLHEGHGKIRIANQLDVFFSPTQAKLTSSDLHKKVQFYLGFSYDGLRADSYSIKIIE